jgi:bifunctional non-homologous end joining protein LigD
VVAQQIRAVLETYGIEGYPKTSGATGMHIFIPLAPGHTFEHSQAFAEIILRLAGQRAPELTTEVWWVERRPQDRVFLDFRQNARGKTVPPPYSPRPHPGAPVSTPLFWREIKQGLDPSQFTIKSVLKRLEKYGDIMAGALPGSGKGQRLMDILERIQNETGSPAETSLTQRAPKQRKSAGSANKAAAKRPRQAGRA